MPVARTTVTIHAETHERLKDENQETESMDETINRLLDK
jgi:predicted CopG family antitoxin